MVIACGDDAPGRPAAWTPDHYDVTTVETEAEVLAALEDEPDVFVLAPSVWRTVAPKLASERADPAPKVLVLGTPERGPAAVGVGSALPAPVSVRSFRQALFRLVRVRAYERTMAELLRCIGERVRFEADETVDDHWSDPEYLDLVVETEHLGQRARDLLAGFDDAAFGVALASLRTPDRPADADSEAEA